MKGDFLMACSHLSWGRTRSGLGAGLARFQGRVVVELREEPVSVVQGILDLAQPRLGARSTAVEDVALQDQDVRLATDRDVDQKEILTRESHIAHFAGKLRHAAHLDLQVRSEAGRARSESEALSVGGHKADRNARVVDVGEAMVESDSSGCPRNETIDRARRAVRG